MGNIVCNENVFCEAAWTGDVGTRYEFSPAAGYALWRDNETGNLDENGQPMCYWLGITCWDEQAADYAPHIWAKLIDETMEVFGDVDPNRPMLMSLSLDDEPAEPSHTYIDENGVELDKKGVY